MVVRITDITRHQMSNDDGGLVFTSMQHALQSSADPVTLSFEGVMGVTSSFVNSALIPLLESMTMDQIKARVRIVHSNRQINDLIKRRFEQESKLAHT